MPLLRSSTRPVAVQCFFCLSPSLLPPHPSTPDRKGKGKIAEVGTKWNWKCDRCGCWNIKDETGEMVSDLPAMHDTAYNERSFSLRAKPSSSHIPSSLLSTSSPFCHSCLANQTLIMNMLANYLPDDDDPSYPSLFAELPIYLAKLQSRYPPVCRNCQPAVDEALQKSDHRAQVQAWSSALDRGSRTAGPSSGKSALNRVGQVDIIVWRVRGLLWWMSAVLSMATTSSSRLQTILNNELSNITLKPFWLLGFHLLSVLWIAWDPYWLRRMRNRDQIKVEGKNIWVRNMLLITVLRVIGSLSSLGIKTDDSSRVPLTLLRVAFALELIIHSLTSIRISQPVKIKLVRPVSLTSTPMNSTTTTTGYSIPNPPSSPTNHLSSLSLSNTISHRQITANPIFGQASLHQPIPDIPVDGEPMDWEPTQQSNFANTLFSPTDEDELIFDKKENWDKFGINKQRMFHNQNETGLENLLAGWGINNSNPNLDSNSTVRSLQMKKSKYLRNNQKELRSIAYHAVKQVTIALITIRIIGIGISTFSADISIGFQAMNQHLLVIESINTILQVIVYQQYCTYTPASLSIKVFWTIFDIIIRLSIIRFGEGSIPWAKTLTSITNHHKIFLEYLIWGTMDVVGLFIG
uniref:Ima1 N-terminal domain-containing protein n=1 Tax=Kwoniella pini CBS 10737 TaxID=1296096 RepID=A0A1B9HUF1_9TREE|nr:uncharacterized protein I206_07282 [Kwoniella pini CBS 10737]OCF46895.1 hypothetical protein I206_07282 [Kwoniella pini CBS 10737]